MIVAFMRRSRESALPDCLLPAGDSGSAVAIHAVKKSDLAALTASLGGKAAEWVAAISENPPRWFLTCAPGDCRLRGQGRRTISSTCPISPASGASDDAARAREDDEAMEAEVP